MIVFLGNFILHLVHYFNEKNCQYGIFTKKYFVEIYTNCINNFSTKMLKTLLKMLITCLETIHFKRFFPLFDIFEKRLLKSYQIQFVVIY